MPIAIRGRTTIYKIIALDHTVVRKYIPAIEKNEVIRNIRRTTKSPYF
jgi:hypothetical protein